MSGKSPLILTARFDESSQSTFDALRERHFPPDRNMIPAHLSLFNRLPGEMEESIIQDLGEVCAEWGRMPCKVDGLRFLGRGVAYTVDAPALRELRAELAQRWEPWLSRQDRQRLSPHVTIQNKVEPERARALYDELNASFMPADAAIEGVMLWRYLGGPWEPVQYFLFPG